MVREGIACRSSCVLHARASGKKVGKVGRYRGRAQRFDLYQIIQDGDVQDDCGYPARVQQTCIGVRSLTDVIER